jgi:hypothetical protein
MFCFNIQFFDTINWYQKKEFPLTLRAVYSNVRQRKWITQLREFESPDLPHSQWHNWHNSLPSSLSLHSWHTFCYLSINYINYNVIQFNYNLSSSGWFLFFLKYTVFCFNYMSCIISTVLRSNLEVSLSLVNPALNNFLFSYPFFLFYVIIHHESLTITLRCLFLERCSVLSFITTKIQPFSPLLFFSIVVIYFVLASTASSQPPYCIGASTCPCLCGNN